VLIEAWRAASAAAWRTCTALGEGSAREANFVLRLPVAEAPPVQAQSPCAASGVPAAYPVVYDNVDAAESLGTMLAYSGMTCVLLMVVLKH